MWKEEGVLVMVSTLCHPQFCQMFHHQQSKQKEQIHRRHRLQNQKRCKWYIINIVFLTSQQQSVWSKQ
jgi:phenylalanine-4-hydroxylase